MKMIATGFAVLMFGVALGLGQSSVAAAEISSASLAIPAVGFEVQGACNNPEGRPIVPTGDPEDCTPPPGEGLYRLHVWKSLDNGASWMPAVASDFCPSPPSGWANCVNFGPGGSGVNAPITVYDPLKEYCWYAEWTCCGAQIGSPYCMGETT